MIAGLKTHLPELARLQVVEGISIGSRRTAGGAKIDSTWVKAVRDRSPAGLFECAAPKLIHHVLHAEIDVLKNGMPPGLEWSMTEMWVGPGDGYHENGVVYGSCLNCQQILPMMLCGLAPVSLEEEDGFTKAVSKGTRKNMRAGRK